MTSDTSERVASGVAVDDVASVPGPGSGNGSGNGSDEPPRKPRETLRSLHRRTLDEKFSLVGSLVAALALVWVVYEQLLAWSGTLGFLLCWYATFVALYAGVTAIGNPWPVVVDRVMSSLVQGGAFIVATALLSSVFYTFFRGWAAIWHVNFWTQDMSGVGPQDPLTKGGILHAIVGSMIEIGIAVIITLPLGVGTAVFMTEVGGNLSRIVRTVVEAMTALPSIVAGLFIYTTLIVGLGFPRSGFTASMAISVMMLPIIARASEVTLRVVPGGLREASLALGASTWQTVWRVVLPTARPGLATALILGIARGIGETSPVLLTSGATTYLTVSPFSDPMNSLPLFVFSSVRSGEPLAIARGFGAASALLALVLILFIVTRILARPRVGSS